MRPVHIHAPDDSLSLRLPMHLPSHPDRPLDVVRTAPCVRVRECVLSHRRRWSCGLCLIKRSQQHREKDARDSSRPSATDHGSSRLRSPTCRIVPGTLSSRANDVPQTKLDGDSAGVSSVSTPARPGRRAVRRSRPAPPSPGSAPSRSGRSRSPGLGPPVARPIEPRGAGSAEGSAQQRVLQHT